MLSTLLALTFVQTEATPIKVGGLPGLVQAIGPAAEVIVVGKSGKSWDPVGVRSRLGNGKVVALGHDSFLVPDTPSATAFLRAQIAWASPGGNPRVGCQTDAMVTAIRALGFEVRRVAVDSVANDTDVYVTNGYGSVGNLDRWVRGGKGLIVGVTPWGWLQTHPGKTLAYDLAINAVLRPAGITFADGTNDELFLADASSARTANAYRNLADLEGKQPADAEQILRAYRSVPKGDAFAARVRTVAEGYPRVVPTEKTPLKADNPGARLKFAVAPPTSGYDFPGNPSPNARMVTQSIAVQSGRGGWQSTGAYAAPGQTIEVTIPESAAGKGYRVLIGGHTDTLWHLAEWRRNPEISRSADLNAPTVRLSNPFGGLVYIDRPANQRVDFSATIKNVIPAGMFMKGKSTVAGFRDQLNAGAPWAEFVGDDLIITVPTETARGVANPQALVEFWDKCLAWYEDLDGRPLPKYPERFMPDRQISAGYMHSGYPIMTWMDVCDLVTNVQKLSTEGSWGHWHELGHNHQEEWWTFEGTGEVSNNLFTLYLMQQMAHRDIWDRLGKDRKSKWEAYQRAGHPFAMWKQDPFLALTMYAELIDTFGWDPLKAVFRSYRTDPASARPKSDAEKRDQWMVRYSKAVNRNLGPFFQEWGVPTSERARASIANLPDWSGPKRP